MLSQEEEAMRNLIAPRSSQGIERRRQNFRRRRSRLESRESVKRTLREGDPKR
jgi:hypothetical protein